MDSLNSVWQSILAEISKNITSTAYNTWFADCSPVELGETNMVIQTTSDFKRSVITSRFGEVIRAALREIFSCDMDLVVLTTEELEMQKQRHHMTEIPPEMDGHTFDLTSEQFREHLNYRDNPEQFRQVHFAKEEKRQRYELLKRKLLALCQGK